ncbi:hypothetical protein OG777_13655 [Micromonospora peucetia]|uniref:hypothetical protein n=1 Tax=Micromonospora peucetia TaxID=47871 RepID=UPI0022553E02|nr:hypothetical protein [Micromonospora peucetia]MCX4387974.1 hypothetical protein [Micromonospora peucetia]
MPNLPSRPTSVLRVAAAAVLSVGVAASMQACATPTPEAGDSTASPTASAPATGSGATTDAPSPTASKSKDGAQTGSADPILRGERQIVLRPVASFESILAVDDKGRLNLTDGDTDKNLFVLLPAGGSKYQIRTAKAQKSGEPDCMGLRDNGSAPATVVATACDSSRAGQLFVIEKTEKKDEGRPTYTIGGEGKVYLRATDGQGLTAQRVGEGDAGEGLTFDFVDNGAAPAGPGD